MEDTEPCAWPPGMFALDASNAANGTIEHSTTGEDPEGDGPTVIAPSVAIPSAPGTRPDVYSTTRPRTTMPPTVEPRVEMRWTDLPLRILQETKPLRQHTKDNIRTMDPVFGRLRSTVRCDWAHQAASCLSPPLTAPSGSAITTSRTSHLPSRRFSADTPTGSGPG